jgi:hypothetical protein
MMRGDPSVARVDALRSRRSERAEDAGESFVRYVSVPERLGVFAVGVGVAALAYPRVSHATGVGVPCPLRTLTGIPCPACGMTTASTDLVAGDPNAALTANPFVLGLVVLAVVAMPLLALRAAGLIGPPVACTATTRRWVNWLGALLAGLSWIYQLHRFGFL